MLLCKNYFEKKREKIIQNNLLQNDINDKISNNEIQIKRYYSISLYNLILEYIYFGKFLEANKLINKGISCSEIDFGEEDTIYKNFNSLKLLLNDKIELIKKKKKPQYLKTLPRSVNLKLSENCNLKLNENGNILLTGKKMKKTISLNNKKRNDKNPYLPKINKIKKIIPKNNNKKKNIMIFKDSDIQFNKYNRNIIKNRIKFIKKKESNNDTKKIIYLDSKSNN